MDKKKLGLKIKELRSKYSTKTGEKFTGQMLADKIGISRSYLGDIENGRILPNNDILLKIATALEVDISEFDDENLPQSKDIPLNKKDEVDIARTLNRTLDSLESAQDGLMFDGIPIDDETRELLKISLENSMRLAKQIAKQKYTPNKYKK